MKNIIVIINRIDKTSNSFFEYPQAAETLGIHVNTLRYRLKSGYYHDNNYIVILSTLHPHRSGSKTPSGGFKKH